MAQVRSGVHRLTPGYQNVEESITAVGRTHSGKCTAKKGDTAFAVVEYIGGSNGWMHMTPASTKNTAKDDRSGTTESRYRTNVSKRADGQPRTQRYLRTVACQSKSVDAS